MMTIQPKSFDEIQRAAQRAYPELTPEQAVTCYMEENPEEYDAYVAQHYTTPVEDTLALWEEIERLALEAFPDDTKSRAIERFLKSKKGKALYKRSLQAKESGDDGAVPDTTFVYTPPRRYRSAFEQRFFERARKLYPDLPEPQAVLAFSETDEGAQLYAKIA